MGYCFMVDKCFGCGGIFTFNPKRVPSIPIDGVRQPICRTCVERVNPLRVANGLEPIVPAPDAYDVLDEKEL